VCLPTLNEAKTIGRQLKMIKKELMVKKRLVDELCVVDSGSVDNTRKIARKLGVPVYLADQSLPDLNSYKGKGENLWKSLYLTEGEIIVWVDADIRNFHPRFVYGLVGPLLHRPEISYVKSFYRRPLKVGRKMIPGELAHSLDIGITAGGKKRQDSVYNGLSALGDPGGVVLIHDGVRPFVSQDLITACIEEAEKCGACIAAVPAFDTLKKADCENFITGTVPRDCIWLAQTPQAFSMRIIREAFESAVADGFYATDEASLVERVGGKVRIVEGSRMNMKITSRGDLEIAEHLFKIIKNPDENPEVKNGK
ncbi:MAG: 2-C-methyl-D-erythritol 4-phosphate cytidylyltransferase, partial [Desulfosalsimonas sp.]